MAGPPPANLEDDPPDEDDFPASTADRVRPKSASSPRRRQFLAGIVSLGAGLPIAGCGGTDGPTTGTGAPPGSDPGDGTSPRSTSPEQLGQPAAPLGPWPQARADAGNTGVVDAVGPVDGPSVRWSTTGAGTVGAAVGTSAEGSANVDRSTGVDESGTGAYVTAEDGRVAAVAADGEVRWRTAVAEARFPPAVADGRVVVPERERLAVLDADTGARVRSVDIPGGILYAPTLVGARAFVGTFSAGVVAVDVSSGDTYWQRGAPSRAYPPVVVGEATDGAVFVTARRWSSDGDSGRDEAGVLAAFDAATGDRLWEIELDGNPTAPPGYHDGVVYAGTHRGHVYAVDADAGEERWRETVGDWVTRGPTAAADGVYVVVLGEGAVKLGREGTVRWRSESGGSTNPVLVGDVALLGTDDGVVALGRDDGRVRWRGETDAEVQFDVRLAGGSDRGGDDERDVVAYAGDRYGTVFAFDIDSGEERVRLPFRPATMPGPVVGPRTVAGASRDGGTYDLLAVDGLGFPRAGAAGSEGITPVFLDSGGESDGGRARETLLGGSVDGSLFRVRTVEYGDPPSDELRPTPTPTATPGPGEPTRTPTPHIDFPPPETLWEKHLDAGLRSPVTCAGGVAYLGTDEGVAAVDPYSGRLRWERALDAPVSGAPAVLGGRVFAVTRSGRLLALAIERESDSAETPRIDWETSLGAAVNAGPAAIGESVFLATEDGDVVSLGTGGERRWRRTVAETGSVYGGPSATDGRVFVGTTAGEVVALDRGDGSVLWRSPTDGPVHATPAVGRTDGGSDRIVYAGDREGTLSAFDAAEGDVRFRLSLGRWLDAPPAIGHGAVFVADQTGRVYAVVDGD